MPERVSVDPDKENIYVAVTRMETKSKFKVKVEKFDSKQDETLRFKK
jgi:uncharacterized protein YpmS